MINEKKPADADKSLKHPTADSIDLNDKSAPNVGKIADVKTELPANEAKKA